MSDTSKREELIERAAKALHRAAWGEDIAEPADPDYMAEMRRQAEMVIAVFEKAHTPADDERTWVTGFLLGCGVAPDRAEEYAGKLLAAGFRRTAVQPEPPTPEAWRDSITDERTRQMSKGYGRDHDEAHGLDHLLVWAQEYARIDEPLKSAALIEAARDLARRTAVQEPQGEPTEAQVVAALDAYDDARTNNLAERGDAMRAALRAALKEGENR